MRRRDQPPQVGDHSVPAALLDHNSPVWRSRRLFDAWHLEHLDSPAPSEDGEWSKPTWAIRFNAGARAWAVRSGIVEGRVESRPISYWLSTVGVNLTSSLEHAAARKGHDSCLCPVGLHRFAGDSSRP